MMLDWNFNDVGLKMGPKGAHDDDDDDDDDDEYRIFNWNI